MSTWVPSVIVNSYQSVSRVLLSAQKVPATAAGREMVSNVPPLQPPFTSSPQASASVLVELGRSH